MRVIVSGTSRKPARVVRGAHRDFWQQVNSGEVRLTSDEDALLASLRAAHWDWPFIARAILERRKRQEKSNASR